MGTIAVPPYMHPIAVAVQPAERHRGRGEAQAPGLASLSRLRGAGCGIRNGRGDFDHRLQSVADYSIAAQDVVSAVEQARGFDGVDPDRVGLWFFSGGGLLVADWLAAPPSWLRCVVMTYPVLAAPSGWDVEARFDPVAAVSTAPKLPIVLIRVGGEYPDFA